MSKKDHNKDKSVEKEEIDTPIKRVEVRPSDLPVIQEIGDKSFAKERDILNFRSLVDKSEKQDAETLTPAEREVLEKAKALTEGWEKIPAELPVGEFNIYHEDNILPLQQALAQALVKAYQATYYPEDPKNHDWAIEQTLESGRSYADWEKLVLNHYFDLERRVGGGAIWYFWESATADVSHYPSLEDLFQDDDLWSEYDRIWDDDTHAHVGILKPVKKEDLLKSTNEKHKYYGWSDENHGYYELFEDEGEVELNKNKIVRFYKGITLIELIPDISRFLRPCVAFAISLRKANIRILFPLSKDEFECLRGIIEEFAETYNRKIPFSLTKKYALTYYYSIKKGYLKGITNEKIVKIEQYASELKLHDL